MTEFAQSSHALLASSGGDVLLMTLLTVGPIMAVYGALQLVGDLKKTSKKKIATRLKGRVSSTKSGDAFESLRKQGPKADGVLGDLFKRMKFSNHLQRVLEQCNLRWSAPQYLSNLTLVAVIVAAVMVLLQLPIVAALGAAVAVYIVPILYLYRRRKKRLNKLASQLPDMFELLGQALRAGHSLASGMQLIAQEMPDPAGTEFSRVFHEQNLGLKIEDALVNLAKRMDVLDVRIFVTAVLIQRQTGGDLSEVLEKIGSVIRDRIKLHGTVQSLTAEGRLSGGVLLALPIVVFLAMLKINYEYAEMLWAHPTGQMMSLVACVQMLMGWMMIKKIINIKV